MRQAFVYILPNASHTLYCGMTTDLRARRSKKVALIQAMNPNWLDLSPRPLRMLE